MLLAVLVCHSHSLDLKAELSCCLIQVIDDDVRLLQFGLLGLVHQGMGQPVGASKQRSRRCEWPRHEMSLQLRRGQEAKSVQNMDVSGEC